MALALVLVTFAGVLYSVMARELREQVDQSLATAAETAIRSIEQTRATPSSQFEDLAAQFPELAVMDKFFQIFSPTGGVTIQSPHLKPHNELLSRAALDAALAGQTIYQSVRFSDESPMRLFAVPVFDEAEHLVHIVQVGTTLQPVETMLQRLLLLLLILLPVALVVSLAAGWFLAGWALAPVGGITQAARRI
ncbi:MAG: sensor histidine kinase N-terminal domain-containing protein, partial [Nitrospira sp.]